MQGGNSRGTRLIKTTAVVLVIGLAVALAACGNDGTLELTPPGSNSPSPAPTATPVP